MNGAVSGLAAGTAMDASGNIADMSGFELLAGTVNADTITGGDGTWDGGEGLNTLDGGTGSMSLTGRAGTDIVAFSTRLPANNIDRAQDFNVAADTIGLDDAIFVGLALGKLKANAFIANGAGVAATEDHRILCNTTTGQLLSTAMARAVLHASTSPRLLSDRC